MATPPGKDARQLEGSAFKQTFLEEGERQEIPGRDAKLASSYASVRARGFPASHDTHGRAQRTRGGGVGGGSAALAGDQKERKSARQEASGRTPPSPLQAKPTTQDAAAQHPSQAVGGVADRKPGTEAGRWEAGGALKEQDPAKEGQPRKTARLPSASLKRLLALLRAESSLPLARIPAELPRGCELQRVKSGSPSALIAVALVLRLRASAPRTRCREEEGEATADAPTRVTLGSETQGGPPGAGACSPQRRGWDPLSSASSASAPWTDRSRQLFLLQPLLPRPKINCANEEDP